MDRGGFLRYTFHCQEKIPSPEELKEANELLDRVELRLLDLNRIITVAKFVMRDEIEKLEEKVTGLVEENARQRESLEIIQENLSQVTSLSMRISALEPKHLRMVQLINGIRGKFSLRVAMALVRGYESGSISDKPIEELTDDELLSIRNLGPKALAEIRQIIPGPKNEPEQTVADTVKGVEL